MDNDYNEYEEDIEDNYYSSEDEDNKSFYTNNSDNENELSDSEDIKKHINSEKDDIEDIKIEEDILSEEDYEENIDTDEEEEKDIENKELIEYKKKINSYKKQNIEMFSKLGMISYLCNLVEYVKNGGSMIDNRNDIEYPYDTEESYVFESILLNSEPFKYVVNNHLIEITEENKIICLKIALRSVDENKKIFFTENFRKRFPMFKKNLFNNFISEEEKEEIEKNKKDLIKMK